MFDTCWIYLFRNVQLNVNSVDQYLDLKGILVAVRILMFTICS